MRTMVWTANILGWPLIHIAIGKIAIHIPRSFMSTDGVVCAPRSWERNGEFYRRRFAIRRWKRLLPDGAPWLGGIAKRRLSDRSAASIDAFIVETRRAELAHWWMLLCFPIFMLWNPPWASDVMFVYAVAANLPCIVVQRYNRFKLMRLSNPESRN
jgi:glycosyl-4,4'-diaponeurosporenoate acyltransferase